jgi:uncharacterized protein (DUF697 family)
VGLIDLPDSLALFDNDRIFLSPGMLARSAMATFGPMVLPRAGEAVGSAIVRAYFKEFGQT